jgi:hypothetical protein
MARSCRVALTAAAATTPKVSAQSVSALVSPVTSTRLLGPGIHSLESGPSFARELGSDTAAAPELAAPGCYLSLFHLCTYARLPLVHWHPLASVHGSALSPRPRALPPEYCLPPRPLGLAAAGRGMAPIDFPLLSSSEPMLLTARFPRTVCSCRAYPAAPPHPQASVRCPKIVAVAPPSPLLLGGRVTTVPGHCPGLLALGGL